MQINSRLQLVELALAVVQNLLELSFRDAV
jgi:hypothetical protein